MKIEKWFHSLSKEAIYALVPLWIILALLFCGIFAGVVISHGYLFFIANRHFQFYPQDVHINFLTNNPDNLACLFFGYISVGILILIGIFLYGVVKLILKNCKSKKWRYIYNKIRK